MIVDAHVHVSGAVHHDDPPRDVNDLLRAMDSVGIDVAAVMSLMAGESEGLEAAGKHPERLVCFAIPDISKRTRQQVAVMAAEGKVRGLGEFYLQPGASRLPEAYLDPVLASARAYGLPVMLHTGEFSYTAPALMARIAVTYPEVAIILGHMGSLAFALDAIEVAKRYNNVYLETSGMQSVAMLRRAVGECGADRLLFGSDYPYWDPEVELARIEHAGLGAEATGLVLGANAARLLGI